MKRMLAIALLALAGMHQAQAEALPPMDVNEAFKTIMIEGEDLPMALGLPLESLSLAAMIDGVLEPVPYQIDTYNLGGAPYFEGWEIPPAGTPGQFNPSDKLLFVFKDAGPQLPADVPVDGQTLAEIRLTDSGGHPRYVYLQHNARLRSDEQYVRYSAELGRVETDFYALRYRADNHLLWDDIQFPFYVGEQPLDAMKLNVNAGVANPLIRMNFDNDNMVAKPVGAIIGPIRTTTQADFVVHFTGVPLIRLSLQIHHYPRAVIYDVRGVMPRFLRTVAYDPTVSMVLDFNDLRGAEIHTAADPANVAKVDGQISPEEAQLQQLPLSPAENRTWIRVHSKRNLDTLSFLDYVAPFNEPLSLTLQDDATRQGAGERFAGHLPALGYQVDRLPRGGSMGMIASIYFSESFAGDPQQVADDLRTQPEIQIRAGLGLIGSDALSSRN